MLTIGGVQMPEPKALTVTKEKVWSSNTGRSSNGVMHGDLIGIKTKLQITFPPLSGEQAALIDNAVSPAFFEAIYKDPGLNDYVKKTFYAGTPSYPVYSYAKGFPEYNGIAVDLIEQ